MTDYDWPVAEFDPVRRLRVIAATTPGASIHETVVAAPLESVWAVAADLEGELPRWLFPDIRSITVTPAIGSDRLVARALGRSGLRARFDVVLLPGWCLMQSRFLLGGMAATEEFGATRFALLPAAPRPSRPVDQPSSRWPRPRSFHRTGTPALTRTSAGIARCPPHGSPTWRPRPSHQPRPRHSCKCGRSVASVVSLPWPG
jgi:hypothetical protein